MKRSVYEGTILTAIYTLLRFALHVSQATGNQMTDALQRQVRALTYPEDSEMGLFFALAIPLDDPVSTKSVSVAFFFESNYELPNNVTDFFPDYEGGRDESARGRRKRSIDRRTVYAMLESKFESIGFHGRQCLLRSICETQRQYGIHNHNGVLGDILRIVLTPSSSADEGLPEEFLKAENVPPEVECSTWYPECPVGIYDYITIEHV